MQDSDKQAIAADDDAISALADGCLAHDAVGPLLRRLGAEPQARVTWLAYHVIGDVLRSPEYAGSCLKPGFVDRLSERLAQPDVAPAPLVAAASPKRVAANADVFRWKMVAGFASVVAVLAVGWNVLSLVAGPQAASGGLQAAAPAAGPTAMAVAQRVQEPTGGGAMLRDPQLDAMLAAHKQLGGTGALQASTGFLRNATFEGVSR